MNDEQALLTQMSTMPIGDKISLRRATCGSLGRYLNANKGALQELAKLMEMLPGGSTKDRRVALFHWAKLMGMDMDEVVLCHSTNGQQVNIVCQQQKVASVVFDDGDMADYESYVQDHSTPAVEDVAMNELVLLERLWLEDGESSPVVKAEFTGKTRLENGNMVLDDRDKHAWDCTLDLFVVPVDQRRQAEMGELGAVWWKKGAATPDAVKVWGPDYVCNLSLHAPSDELLRMRQALRIMRTTPQAVGQRHAQRL